MGAVVKTACPYCGVGCGVLATTSEDGTVSISGDPDHPANKGRLCSKGSALGETLSLDDRLLEPLIDGAPVSWDEALDRVAHEFSATIAEHGPDSVAFYVSGQILTEDYYVANKLMKGFIGSGNIDTNSRLCMASSVAGHKRAFGSDTVPGNYEDLEKADSAAARCRRLPPRVYGHRREFPRRGGYPDIRCHPNAPPDDGRSALRPKGKEWKPVSAHRAQDEAGVSPAPAR